ncbi:hypothetical protein EKO04_011283 [Ascochyta lentis]|uniref:Uncharacterized protein n=1 Tax=Ascochyta lentis TaxID=205686 RepID=A0A8H7IVB8_9PLEO|nr:hypothetical protein EKO04_011283 [Ascochyta lentis]
MERFDSASRGSWGSISLLCHLHPKQAYYIAALGAVATVMASLTGFFSQQLIQFQDCRQLDTSATVGIARTNWSSLAGLQVQNMQPDIYPPMLAAINVGIIQPADDLTRVLSRGCISGNCTFPGNDASFNGKFHSEVIKTVTDVQSDFVGIHVLFRPHVQLRNYTAVSCEIFPTVNTYAAKVSNSVLEERLIDSIRIKTVSEQFKDPTVSKKTHADSSVSEQAFWYRHRMTTNYTLRDGARESCEGSEKNQTGFVRFFKSIDQSATSDPKTNASVGTNWKWWYYPQDCVWTVHSFTTISIQNAFKEIFDDKMVNQARRGGLVGPVHLRQLWNGGNMTLESVNELMSNLTTSMMAVIRTHTQEQDKGPTWIKGDMWINTTCMYIRWPWITFPAVMIGLTGVFLVLVAIQNRGVESERLWKSSVLATLFCAVEYGDKDTPRPESRQAMEYIAKSTSVSLEGKTGSLKLVAR